VHKEAVRASVIKLGALTNSLLGIKVLGISKEAPPGHE